MVRVMQRNCLILFVTALAICGVALLFPEVASAQCALCRASAEHVGEGTGRVLNLGIIVLLIPPVAIFCAIYLAAFKSGSGED